MNLLPNPEILVAFDKSFEQESLIVNPSSAPVVKFVVRTHHSNYLDLQSSELKVETNFGKDASGNTNLKTEVFDAFTVPIAGG